MKRFMLAIMAIVVIIIVGFAPLAQAVTVNGERQVGASQQPTYTKSESYQQPVVAPVAYQQPVPEVTAKQFDALRARLKDLEKKQATQATKIAEANTAATDAKVIGNQAVEKAKEANGKADKNSALLEEHRNWMVKMKEAHDITAASVSDLVLKVDKLLQEVKDLAEEIKNTYVIALAGMIIAIFAGVIAAVCFIFGLFHLFGGSNTPKEEKFQNFKK